MIEVTDEMIEEGYMLVKFTIKKYYPFYANYEKTHGLTFDDLLQIGITGWWKSLEAYDETKGEFSTIAAKYIRTEIHNETRGTYKSVKANHEVIKIAKYIRKNKEKETLSEVQKRFNVSDEVIKRAMSLSNLNVISGEKEIGKDEDTRIFDTIYDEKAQSDVEMAGLITELDKRLNILSEAQRTSIELRLKGYELEEIGEILGRKSANISTLISHGLKKINTQFNLEVA